MRDERRNGRKAPLVATAVLIACLGTGGNARAAGEVDPQPARIVVCDNGRYINPKCQLPPGAEQAAAKQRAAGSRVAPLRQTRVALRHARKGSAARVKSIRRR